MTQNQIFLLALLMILLLELVAVLLGVGISLYLAHEYRFGRRLRTVCARLQEIERSLQEERLSPSLVASLEVSDDSHITTIAEKCHWSATKRKLLTQALSNFRKLEADIGRFQASHWWSFWVSRDLRGDLASTEDLLDAIPSLFFKVRHAS